MADTLAPATQVQNSGGFRIETSADALTVAEATSTSQRLWMYVFYTLLIGWLLIRSISEKQYILLAIVLLLAVGILRGLSVHNLRCTRDNLEVIDVFYPRTRRIRAYARTDVKQIRFGPASFSKYGAIGGLIFEATGKRIKVLYGLKCVEAQAILDQLRRLGFDVFADVGMPMMIEMEQSRRRSWLSKLFN